MKRNGFIFHIRHIAPFSAFKVGCLTTALGLTGLFACALLAALPLAIAGKVEINTLVAGFTAAPVIFIAAALIYGFGPGLALAYHAVIYNIVARFFGGFVVTLNRTGTEIGTQAQPVRPTQVMPDNYPPPTPTGSAQPLLRDEVAELNRQIKERQRRIADIHNQIPKAPKS